MLVHVFNRLLTQSWTSEDCLEFLYEVLGTDEITSVRKSGPDLVVEYNEEEVKWPSGILYQKLGEVNSKFSVPVLWALLRYYDVHQESSDLLRTYVETLTGVKLEPAPFCWDSIDRHLSSRCTAPKKAPKGKPKKVKFVVDKPALDVILLPHRGVVRAMLRRLEEVSL